MTAAQEITAHFGGDWHGTYGTFPTPGHSKRDRGMKIEDREHGDVQINTFNGGDVLAVKDECRRLGLLPAREIKDERPAWRTTGTYEYRAADGTLVYRTVRKEKQGEGKRFVAERPDGQGGWIGKLGDVPRVPYRLPELLAADPEELVYFVEGEKKADHLAKWGLVATAVAFGCKGWRSDYARYLSGRNVIILPDNDDPGKEFAAKVHDSIVANGAKATIVNLPLPPKGDIIDWSGNGHSRFDLEQIVDKALNPPVALLPLIDMTQWSGRRPPPREWLVKDWIPRKQTTLLTGEGGVGKSLLAQQLCTAIALGKPFMGQPVETEHVLYVSCEDDEDELWRRQDAICAAYGVSLEAIVGKLQLVSLVGATDAALATYSADGRLIRTDRWRQLMATMDAKNVSVVAFDNATDAMAGDLNDIHQVAEFVMMLTGDIALRRGGAALLVHHPNKAGDEWLGSVAWHNKVRSRLILTRSDADPDARILANPKANYGPSGSEITFRWAAGAFVRPEDLPVDQRKCFEESARAANDNAIFLDCLRVRAGQGDGRGVGPSPGPNYAPKQFEGMPAAKGLRSDRLKQAMERLFAIGALESVTERVPGKGRSVTTIREVPNTPEPDPRTVPEHSPNRPPNAPELHTEHPRTHSVDTTYQKGGPLGAAPPFELQDPADGI